MFSYKELKSMMNSNKVLPEITKALMYLMVYITLSVMTLVFYKQLINTDDEMVEIGMECQIEPVPYFELRLKHKYRNDSRYDLYMIDVKGEYRVGHGYIDRPLFDGKSYQVIIVIPD